MIGYFEDNAEPELYDETKRTARKSHQCACCFRKIEPGSQYMDCTGKWDGDFGRYRIHMVCHDLYLQLNDIFYGESLPFQNLRDAVLEADMEWPPPLEANAPVSAHAEHGAGYRNAKQGD